MFLHVSVILFTGGEACVPDGGVRGGGHACPGGGGGHAWQGACMPWGGMHTWGGHAWQGGMRGRGVWQGMRGMHAPPPPTPRDTVDQCAAGTHPTGMHSCSYG